MKCSQKSLETTYRNGYGARHTLLDEGLDIEIKSGVTGDTDESVEFIVGKIGMDDGIEFVVGKIGTLGGNNRVGLNQEMEWRQVEGGVTKGGPPGFPRGHGAPVCYSNYNTSVRVLTMQGP